MSGRISKRLHKIRISGSRRDRQIEFESISIRNFKTLPSSWPLHCQLSWKLLVQWYNFSSAVVLVATYIIYWNFLLTSGKKLACDFIRRWFFPSGMIATENYCIIFRIMFRGKVLLKLRYWNDITGELNQRLVSHICWRTELRTIARCQTGKFSVNEVKVSIDIDKLYFARQWQQVWGSLLQELNMEYVPQSYVCHSLVIASQTASPRRL